MRKEIVIIMLLLCSVFVSAQFDVTINGKDTDIPLKPDEMAEFSITIPANTVIIGKDVKSDNAALQAVLNEYLDVGPNKLKEEEEQILNTDMTLPSTLPDGKSEITLVFDYIQNEKQGKFTKKLTVDIEGSKALGFASRHVSEETMHAVMDTVNPKPLPKISRDLTDSDMTKMNMNPDDYTRTKIKTLTSTEEKTIDDAMASTDSESAKKIMEYIKDNEKLTIKKELNVFEVKHKTSEESMMISKVILSAKAPKNLKDIVILENIPKSVAESTDLLSFSEKPEIVEKDPIVKWDVTHIAEGQEKEVSYTVNKELDSIDSTTQAAGDTHSITARLLSWLASLFV